MNVLSKRNRTVERIKALAPWFHNLHLPGNLQTAPHHDLGDFPTFKWRQIAAAIPLDLTGWTALDIGCNAGFYSFELARRGATVTAIDSDAHYLRQARWAARKLKLKNRITFKQLQLYNLGRSKTVYDLVLFMGVLYHLRYPLLGLDIAARKTGKLLCLQSMSMPDEIINKNTGGLGLADREQLLEPGWPKMAFIEQDFANDPTNWWIPNHACIEAMLRSCGMVVIERPAEEFYLCIPQTADDMQNVRMRNNLEYAAALGLPKTR